MTPWALLSKSSEVRPSLVETFVAAKFSTAWRKIIDFWVESGSSILDVWQSGGDWEGLHASSTLGNVCIQVGFKNFETLWVGDPESQGLLPEFGTWEFFLF
jgi:hypothetical protein